MVEMAKLRYGTKMVLLSPSSKAPLVCVGAFVVCVASSMAAWAGIPTVDCTPQPATAFKSGNATQIEVVSFDGKPVSSAIVDPLYVMFMAAHADGVDLNLESGFRTYAEQEYLYNCYKNCNCNSCNLAAKPGYSNHQSGHAVDITTGCSAGWSDEFCASKSKSFAWLLKNAAFHGFEKTVPSEPWHWEWWDGGPGGGYCFDSCEQGCNDVSDATMDPLQQVNVGWIGGPCKAHEQCSSPEGFCFFQTEGAAYGMCSEACDKYCPDTPGAVVTFCVEGGDLGINSPGGTCVAKCDEAKAPGGCRPGFQCKVLPRFNDPTTTAPVCVPQKEGFKALSPKGWSMGSSTDTCVFNRCAIEFGEVCNDSASGDSSCVSAQCMDFVTQTLVQGMHCSYLYAEHGDSVVCDDTGHVVSEETCSEEAPCNACGACGPTPEEVCDGKDNDCDGETDEGVLNACGECGEQPVETCDGIDNDCDGNIDEGCPIHGSDTEPSTAEPTEDVSADAEDDLSLDIHSSLETTSPDGSTPTSEVDVSDGSSKDRQSEGCQATDVSRVPLLPLLVILAAYGITGRWRKRQVKPPV